MNWNLHQFKVLSPGNTNNDLLKGKLDNEHTYYWALSEDILEQSVLVWLKKKKRYEEIKNE